MPTQEEADAYRNLVHATMSLETDDVRAALEHISKAAAWIEKRFGLSDDQVKIEHKIPVCICDDDRGWSTCGASCPRHPPEHYCLCGGCASCLVKEKRQGCSRAVPYMQTCRRCTP